MYFHIMFYNKNNNSLERRCKKNDLFKTRNFGTKYCNDGKLQS
jgi:hypothetical protein